MLLQPKILPEQLTPESIDRKTHNIEQLSNNAQVFQLETTDALELQENFLTVAGPERGDKFKSLTSVLPYLDRASVFGK